MTDSSIASAVVTNLLFGATDLNRRFQGQTREKYEAMVTTLEESSLAANTVRRAAATATTHDREDTVITATVTAMVAVTTAINRRSRLTKPISSLI